MRQVWIWSGVRGTSANTEWREVGGVRKAGASRRRALSSNDERLAIVTTRSGRTRGIAAERELDRNRLGSGRTNGDLDDGRNRLTLRRSVKVARLRSRRLDVAVAPIDRDASLSGMFVRGLGRRNLDDGLDILRLGGLDVNILG